MVNKRVGSMRRDNGPGGGGFSYVPAKPEFVKKQMERRGGRQFDNIFKDRYLALSRLQEGDNRLRILPATWKPHDDFALIVWVHKYIAERGSFLCPNKMSEGEKSCPICEEAAIARKDKDEERARQLTASEAMVCWVLDRKSREFEERPQLFAMPPTLYKDICGVIYDVDTGKATMLDHDRKGYDVRIKRTGTGLNTRYLPILANHASPISDDSRTQKEILDYIKEHPVPECLEMKSSKYLENVISGGTASRDDDLDEEDGRGRKRAKVRDYDDADEIEDDEEDGRDREAEANNEEREARASRRDDDDDDEEERKPRRRKLTARDAEDEEEANGDEEEEGDEEEDEPEEDEEEEPRPRRARARSKHDDDEEVDEEEAKPRRKLKPRSTDDEDDEDEEEEKPRRRRAPARASSRASAR